MFSLRALGTRYQQRVVLVSSRVATTSLFSSSSSSIGSLLFSSSSSSSSPTTTIPAMIQAKCFNSSAVSAAAAASSSGTELATANMNLAPEPTTTSASATARATEIAKRVNATKRAHQTATPDERKRLERSAWSDLNTLSEEDIASADGQAVAIVLNAWGYFAKFWERGKEGPIN